jgi:ADP-ribose pyrophosphatase YjhB (NUDIX family)
MLIKENRILLLRRYNTGWNDGKYSFVAGHLDGGESVKQAMIREAKEEACLTIEEKSLEVAHTMHRISPDKEYIDFFLVASAWQGEPSVGEPDKCDEVAWYPLDALPSNTLGYIRRAIEYYQNGITFSEERLV